MSNRKVGGGTTTWDAVTSRLKKHILEGVSPDLEHTLRWTINVMEDQMGRTGGMEPRGWAENKAAHEKAKENLRRRLWDDIDGWGLSTEDKE